MLRHTRKTTTKAELRKARPVYATKADQLLKQRKNL